MKLAIIHYQPLEYYPPVTNFIDYLAKRPSDRLKSVRIYTCINVKGRQKYACRQEDIGLEINRRKETTSINHSSSSFSITRSSFPKESDIGLTRLLKYIHYNLHTLVGLIIYRPNKLLYYESYSVWPVYIYSKYFNRKCHIFIHNHEYESKKEYEKMMTTVKYYHDLEKKWLYPKAQWISQTNADRLKLFHQDHPYISKEVLKVMPNYPPLSWKSGVDIPNKQHLASNILRIIYVGSLSFQSTYIKEFCNWVNMQNGQVKFDIYAYNLYKDVKEYFNNLKSTHIEYFEKGIEYKDMPFVLSKYHIGLILYKAHNENYTYNAPNKLFEYLSCDLSVLYHHALQGPQPYNTKTTFPKVLPIDMENLHQFDWKAALEQKSLVYSPSTYYCEEVFEELIMQLAKT